MREGDRIWIENYLRKLDFVRWDRFIEYQGQQNIIRFFGWIDRQDSYKDFVVIEFVTYPREIFYIISSSAEHSNEINRRIHGEDEKHNDCKRVEHKFNIENVVRLK